MTGQEIQDRLDAIVEDLQTDYKGQYTQIMMRGDDNTANIFSLSSDGAGNVNAIQLAAIQDFIDNLKPLADTYETEYAPVQAASETFRDARAEHQVLIDAASAARVALADALEADASYQTAKTAYDAAREDAGYVAARTAYRTNNVSENYGNLQEARGKYTA